MNSHKMRRTSPRNTVPIIGVLSFIGRLLLMTPFVMVALKF